MYALESIKKNMTSLFLYCLFFWMFVRAEESPLPLPPGTCLTLCVPPVPVTSSLDPVTITVFNTMTSIATSTTTVTSSTDPVTLTMTPTVAEQTSVLSESEVPQKSGSLELPCSTS